MILRHVAKKVFTHTQLAPQQVKRVNNTLGHIEHSGGVAVGVEFLFHPTWWILAATVAVVWLVRMVWVEDLIA